MRRGEALARWQTWVTAAAGLTTVLVLIDISLVERNRALQTEINARAQFLQQSVQLDALNREIVATIASLAVRNNDDALKTVLTEQGITFTATPTALPAPTGAQPVATSDQPGTRR